MSDSQKETTWTTGIEFFTIILKQSILYDEVQRKGSKTI